MAKIVVKFNDTKYQIEETVFVKSKAKVAAYLSSEMKGTGSTIKFGGTTYDVDSTKLNVSAAALAAYLRTIAGSGVRVVIGGVEYGVDSEKVADAVSELEELLSRCGEVIDIIVTYDEPTSTLTIEGNDVAYDEKTGDLSISDVSVDADGNILIGG